VISDEFRRKTIPEFSKVMYQIQRITPKIKDQVLNLDEKPSLDLEKLIPRFKE
jgi:hypothetical protein